jgi:serine/threonine protein kinase/formylglycine-generating enzyme required for sulfatase activity
MVVTVQQFVERLSASGLMSAAEVSTFQDSLPPEKRPKDVQQLAQALVQQGKLTKYQAQAVYQGKTKGLVFGQYVVLDKLGEGGMGVVLKARHRRMDRLVAIKVLPSAAMKQAGAIERFHREVKAAAKLIHPNIATAFDADEHQGMHYLAMEYIEGSDLGAMVKEHGPLPVRQAVECILQAAGGLQYAHEQGIIHRDIKPANLLLDKRGTVKILDMGLARFTGAEAALGGAERLTTTGQAMGTCDYMAPEQSLDTHEADARADIYSLGCTLYRLLTGSPPYQGETVAKLFLMHLEAPIPSLCQARPEVPQALDASFQRMLAKKPEDRYQSMAEVAAELEAVLGALPGHSATITAAAAAKAKSSSATLAKTSTFQQQDKPVGTATRQQQAMPQDQTQPHRTPEHETGVMGKGDRSHLPAQPSVGARAAGASRTLDLAPFAHLSNARGAIAKVRRKPLVLLGLAGGLVLLLAVVLAIALRQGTLASGDPTAPRANPESEISNLRSKIPDSQSAVPNPQSAIHPPPLALVPAPRLAVAPFDETEAKEHQEAWAKHVGVPVDTTNAIGMKLVLIPPGEFAMGEGGDAHRVTITKPFYLGKYEVTQQEWERVMVNTPSHFKGLKNPVESVSWEDCQIFLKRLGEKCGAVEGSYRLPSEAQWEYACRAGSSGKWFFGESEAELVDYGWYKENSEEKTHPVGLKKANDWGLYDVYGNVWQWCADWYDKDYYKRSPGIDPAGPLSGSRRVLRGGSWNHPAGSCRSANRDNREPGYRISSHGLRVSLVLVDK